MKKTLLALTALVFLTSAAARADDYEFSVNGTTINVAAYKLYSDAFPAGQQGPGEGSCVRVNRDVMCWLKVDVQPVTAGVQFSIQFTVPYAFTSSNYAYEIGNCNSPGPTRGGSIFGSQVSVEGNNTTVVFKANPTDTSIRAYSCAWHYKADQ
jgi:hypothetical protein